MSRLAQLYITTVLLAGAVLTYQAFVNEPRASIPWPAGTVFVLLATVAQLYKAQAPLANMAFFATPVFLFAGLLLLPPVGFVILVVAPHLAEWLVERLAKQTGRHLAKWYIQPFNIAMHLIAGMMALACYRLLVATPMVAVALPLPVATLVTAAVYLVVNQLILGQALVLARKISWHTSGVLHLTNLLPEYIMLCLGMLVATLWTLNPWWLVPALTPLVLMYRALQVPQLQQEAQTDSKTGLANARHFQRRFREELERAQRFHRPLAVIMADLDLLRNINNTYGHLAGDAVLEGIGQIIRQTMREYDIAGRFGGEEFAIVLPETGEAEAMVVAERIRQTIEVATFSIPNSPTPIRATMSLGIACFPYHASTKDDLVHQADVAVYQAKFNGRNRVVSASAVPHSMKLNQMLPAGEPSTSAAVPAHAHATGTVTPLVPAVPARFESSAPVVVTPAVRPTDEPQEPAVAGKRSAAGVSPPTQQQIGRLWGFVGGVIAAGVAATVLGGMWGVPLDIIGLVVLMGLAFLAELKQVNVYGDNSMSVSMAFVVAAGVISGMPGVVAVSAAVVLADQVQRRRPLHDLYKVGFNWAVHVLAGVAPVVLIGAPVIGPDTLNLLVLATRMVLAILLYYGIESGLISIAISLSRQQHLLDTWRAQFRWLAGHYLVLGIMGVSLSLAFATLHVLGIMIFTLPVLMLRYAQQQYVQRTQEGVQELKRMNRELACANQEVVTASQAIQHLNDELFVTLGTILDARDPYVRGHAAQVAIYAEAIARELGLPTERVEVIRQAGFLHDLGKIAISEQILCKPSKLTEAEYATMKTHAEIGAAMLETSTNLRHLAPFVQAHHECWDGKGYPAGLRGEDIPLEARILNVCDSVEAMAADRPYHVGMGLPEILAEVRRCAGSQFDPVVAEAFIRVAEREGENFVINSAREVLQSCHTSAGTTQHNTTNLERLYHSTAEAATVMPTT